MYSHTSINDPTGDVLRAQTYISVKPPCFSNFITPLSLLSRVERVSLSCIPVPSPFLVHHKMVVFITFVFFLTSASTLLAAPAVPQPHGRWRYTPHYRRARNTSTVSEPPLSDPTSTPTTKTVLPTTTSSVDANPTGTFSGSSGQAWPVSVANAKAVW